MRHRDHAGHLKRVILETKRLITASLHAPREDILEETPAAASAPISAAAAAAAVSTSMSVPAAASAVDPAAVAATVAAQAHSCNSTTSGNGKDRETDSEGRSEDGGVAPAVDPPRVSVRSMVHLPPLPGDTFELCMQLEDLTAQLDAVDRRVQCRELHQRGLEPNLPHLIAVFRHYCNPGGAWSEPGNSNAGINAFAAANAATTADAAATAAAAAAAAAGAPNAAVTGAGPATAPGSSRLTREGFLINAGDDSGADSDADPDPSMEISREEDEENSHSLSAHEAAAVAAAAARTDSSDEEDDEDNADTNPFLLSRPGLRFMLDESGLTQLGRPRADPSVRVCSIPSFEGRKTSTPWSPLSAHLLTETREPRKHMSCTVAF